MTFYDYASLESRLNETDIFTLIAECDAIFTENPTEFMRLLRSTLSLSAHVLEKDKSALASQLAGRLYHHYDSHADVRSFVDSITPPKNSLYPIRNGYDPLLPAGGMLVRMMKHKNYVRGFKILQNRRILSWDSTELKLWDVNGQRLATLSGHHIAINGALILADRRIVSWDANGKIQLWDEDGRHLKILTSSDEASTTTAQPSLRSVSKMIELSNGYMLSIHSDYQMRLWNRDGELAHTSINEMNIEGILELSDNRILSWDYNTLKIWGLDGELQKVIQKRRISVNVLRMKQGFLVVPHQRGIMQMMNDNGDLIATFGKDAYHARILRNERILSLSPNQIDVWDENGNHLYALSSYKAVSNVTLELSDGCILYRSQDDTVTICTADGKLLSTHKHDDSIQGVYELLDGRILTWGGSQNILHVRDGDGQLQAVLENLRYEWFKISQLPNGHLFSANGRTLNIFALSNQTLSATYPYYQRVYKVLALNDEIIFSASGYRTWLLWDKNGHPITDLWAYNSCNEADIILDNTRMMRVIPHLQQLSFRGIHHQGYPPPYGYEWAEHGAEDLPNGWLIYWEEGGEKIYIEDAEENVIATLDEFYLGNRERIFEWLRQLGVHPDDAYPEVEFPKLGNLRVSYDRFDNLIIYDAHTGKTIHTFYGDATFMSIAVLDNVVIAGDTHGRVIFLRWIE